MEYLDTVRQLYEAYLAKTEQLERDRKPGDGLFGMGSGPADDPCHDRFAEELEAVLGAMARDTLSSGQVRSVLEYIYRMPLENKENSLAYWMLLAVHNLTVELAQRLDAPDAEALWRDYRKKYPRWDRLPAQKRVLSVLDTGRKG